jgi:hypothetical protein
LTIQQKQGVHRQCQSQSAEKRVQRPGGRHEEDSEKNGQPVESRLEL